jgi:hypothetical protein
MSSKNLSRRLERLEAEIMPGEETIIVLHIQGVTADGQVVSTLVFRVVIPPQPMKTIGRRLRRLEDQLRPADGKTTLLLVACNAGQELALDDDVCKPILRESGFLSGPICVMDLTNIPDGLNAQELERYLGEHAAEI